MKICESVADQCSIIISHILYCICRYFCITLHLLCYFIERKIEKKEKMCSVFVLFHLLYHFINISASFVHNSHPLYNFKWFFGKENEANKRE